MSAEEIYYDRQGNRITQEEYERLLEKRGQEAVQSSEEIEYDEIFEDETGDSTPEKPEQDVEYEEYPDTPVPAETVEKPVPDSTGTIIVPESVTIEPQKPSDKPEKTPSKRVEKPSEPFDYGYRDYEAFRRFAIGAKVSTLGLGAELTTRIIPVINLRFGVNGFPLSFDQSTSDIDYDVDYDLFSVSAILDWHPFKGDFRISGGVLYNRNEIDIVSKSASVYPIGDTRYTSDQVKQVNGNISFNEIAPYFGIGFGNAVEKEKGWGFVFDAGIVFQGEPDIELTATGPVTSDLHFRINLENEEEDIDDDIEGLKYYPVVSFGITYKF